MAVAGGGPAPDISPPRRSSKALRAPALWRFSDAGRRLGRRPSRRAWDAWGWPTRRAQGHPRRPAARSLPACEVRRPGLTLIAEIVPIDGAACSEAAAPSARPTYAPVFSARRPGGGGSASSRARPSVRGATLDRSRLTVWVNRLRFREGHAGQKRRNHGVASSRMILAASHFRSSHRCARSLYRRVIT